MMKTITVVIALALLAACQLTPRLADDPRYVRMATVVEIHEFTDLERKQDRASRTGVSVGVGINVGVGTGFGGMMLGMGSRVDEPRDREPPQIGRGANRITVQVVGSGERIEVMSYKKHKIGDCVKVLTGHPSEYPRFFTPSSNENCAPPATGTAPDNR
ncbi:MAG TPA: hypothetical protein VGD24_10045 [Gallionella sp.]